MFSLSDHNLEPNDVKQRHHVSCRNIEKKLVILCEACFRDTLKSLLILKSSKMVYEVMIFDT